MEPLTMIISLAFRGAGRFQQITGDIQHIWLNADC
jgi:hypothetical protein